MLSIGAVLIVLAAWPAGALAVLGWSFAFPQTLHPWSMITLQLLLLVLGTVVVVASLRGGRLTVTGALVAAAAVLLPSLLAVRFGELNNPTVPAKDQTLFVDVVRAVLMTFAVGFTALSVVRGRWPQQVLSFVVVVGIVGTGLAIWRQSNPAAPADVVPLPRAEVQLSSVRPLWVETPAANSNIALIFVVPKRSDEGSVVAQETFRVLARLTLVDSSCRDRCDIRVEVSRGDKDAKLMEALRLSQSSPVIYATVP